MHKIYAHSLVNLYVDIVHLLVYYNNIKINQSHIYKGGFHMRTTRKMLETKVNNYNSISDIKLKLNDDVVGAINL